MVDLIYTPPPTIKSFIRHFLPGELFYDWIVGPVGCLPADSEYLTPTGWKRMDAYAPRDLVAVSTPDGVVSFEQAEHVKLPVCEPFYRFDSGSLEMELSPEHRVLYADYRGQTQVATAAECAAHPSRRTIPTTFVLGREDAPIDDYFIRLRVMFSADGHVPATGKQVMVTVRKERKKARLRELLRACSIQWDEASYEPRPTETRFTFHWSGADKSLDFVWGLSSRQLSVVLDECLRWDGLNGHAEKRYYTTVKEHADAIQFAAHACGFRASIHPVDDPRNEIWKTHYTVAIRASDNAKNKAMIRGETRITRRAAEDGLKYCFTTSTGFFVARCNGKVFITGNSGKTTGIFFKLCYMAGLQAKSSDGIRRSRAVIVRNTMPQLKDTTMVSWDYWFKEGQAGAWTLTEKKFLLRFNDVECEVLFRPLDTPDDIARVLSLEVTFAIIDEFVQIPKEIIEALSARLGRYPSAKDGGATNFGMWGSSNPSTEDNWWFDYLHDESIVHQMRASLGSGEADEMRDIMVPEASGARNAFYWKQPSGLAPAAENLDNLLQTADTLDLPLGHPARVARGRTYYENQQLGKGDAWVKQFIEAEWGFSAAGKPVVPTFNAGMHVAAKPLRYNPHLPVIVGFDPGLGGSAAIFMQQDLDGRLCVLGERVQSGMSVERVVNERIIPYVRRYFPDAELIFAPDPAAANRAQTDEKSAVDYIRRRFKVKIETNNRLPLRLNAIEHFTTRFVQMKPALTIDPEQCPVLIRALKGGWRFEMDTKKYNDVKGPSPEKNPWSHPGDAFGYGCRYFHRLTERELRYSPVPGMKTFRPPTFKSGNYHAR